MAVSAETRAFVLELFDGLGHVTARAMMGGLTLYADGLIFAIVALGDRVYIKADGDLAEALRAEGAEQFAYPRKDGRIDRMGYWTLPDDALDDSDAACAWARASLKANHPGYS
jgi:DNA transformation protein